MKRLLFSLLLIIPVIINAQQYTGMTGLIHVPSAEMDSVGDARIGAHFLNRELLPNHSSFIIDGSKYNTFDTYISLTPFWWIELAYVMTFEKGSPGPNNTVLDKNKFLQKDRHFNIKLNPLKEGKYFPAIAIGMQDFASVGTVGKGLWSNFYIALTKTFKPNNQQIGATLAYRHYYDTCNNRWSGLVGGITYRPSFAKNWRAIAEWTGCDLNVGIDCLLWHHLLLQASLQDGKYPSAGICYKVNLF